MRTLLYQDRDACIMIGDEYNGGIVTEVSAYCAYYTKDGISDPLPYRVKETVNWQPVDPRTGERLTIGSPCRMSDTVRDVDCYVANLRIAGHSNSYPHRGWVLWFPGRPYTELPKYETRVRPSNDGLDIMLDGKWTELREVRCYHRHGRPIVCYDQRVCCELGGELVKRADCVETVEACTQLRANCVECVTALSDPTAINGAPATGWFLRHEYTTVVGGVRYDNRLLFMKVDEDGVDIGGGTVTSIPDGWVAVWPRLRGYQATPQRIAPADGTTELSERNPMNRGRRCGEPRFRALTSELTEEFIGYDVTEEWLNDHTFVCSSCANRYHNDEYGSDERCSGCDYEDSDDGCDCGLPYHGDPTEFDAEEPYVKGRPTFGLELETEPSGSRSDAVADIKRCAPPNYCIMKDDGSLSDAGIEIVTRPDSPAVHKRVLNDMFARLNTLGADNSCGVHIHVDRRELKPLWIGRLLVFLNRKSMEGIVRSVAGRYNAGYSKIRQYKTLKDGRRAQSDRYEALNLHPRNTIEFRLFAGTVCPFAIVRYIEFVESALDFCRPCGRSFPEIGDPAAYIRYMADKRKRWPVLHRFLKKGMPAELADLLPVPKPCKK